MKITKLLMGLLLVLCMACSKEKETPSGLKFTVVKAGDGVTPKPGEVLIFNFVFKDSKDSVWRDTYTMDFPPSAVIPDTAMIKNEDGMTQMLRMLSKGDSVKLEMHIKDFFKDIVRGPMPPQFDSTLVFTYRIKAENIMPQDSFMIYQRNFFTKKQQAQTDKDILLIDEYLAKNNIVAQKTESGLRYVITTPGQGENAKSGQVVDVDYLGYTLDGKYFDTSNKEAAIEKGLYNPEREKYVPYKPYEVIIDRTSVIKGWHEALKLMNKGAKATVYIPSTMAYGPQRKGEIIKENEVLVFDLEAVDVKDSQVQTENTEIRNRDKKGREVERKDLKRKRMKNRIFVSAGFLAGIILALSSCLDTGGISPYQRLQEDVAKIDAYLEAHPPASGDVLVRDSYSGIRMVITEQGTGRIPPTQYNKIEVAYVGKLLVNGDTLEDPFDQDESFVFTLNPKDAGGSDVIEGWKFALAMMTEGTKATVFIPSTLAYGTSGSGSGAIPKNAILVFEMYLKLIITTDQEPRFTLDKAQISGHLEGTPNVVEDPSGVSYILEPTGSGPAPGLFDKVRVKYTAKLLDGTVLIQSFEQGPGLSYSSFVANYNHGLIIGLQQMHEGDKAKIYIPSALGYGPVANGPIPANSNLVYEIELLQVIQ